MNKSSSACVQKGTCRTSGAVRPVRPGTRRTRTHGLPRSFCLSTGIFLFGLSGTTESTPVCLILLRMIFSTMHFLRRFARTALKNQRRVASRKLAGIRANSINPAGRRPIRCQDQESFRGSWQTPQTGAAFKSRRLMRMTHRHLS